MATCCDASITHHFDEAVRHEWLETNGLGGWASSTIVGAHTRRYHGLLVAAVHPPVDRVVLLSKLDETLVAGDTRHALGCNQYPNAIHPAGHRYLHAFTRDFFPIFEYRAGGIVLRKRVAALHGENTTLVLYEALDAPARFTLELQPFIAGRDYHALSHANDAMQMQWSASFRDDLFRVQPYETLPECFIMIPGASFECRPDWYYHFEYRVELYRGLDGHEDLFTHGVFRVELNAGDTLGVIVSTSDPEGRDAFALFERERQRRASLVASIDEKDELRRTLTLAADQFIVTRADDLRTIVAGYPWFGDWGRDAMIALPGLCLVTGRFDDAAKILQAFAQHVSEGMLPNRFPEAGETPEYNTADATLWFFVAIHHYLRYSGDASRVRDAWLPLLLDSIAWHDRGTRYGIHTDHDGLLYAGAPGVQLTWMDAKVGDWVVTPRRGKAVEINALWYNALEITAALLKRFGRVSEAAAYTQRARRVKAAFRDAFWNEEKGCLYDVVDGPHHDAAIRPNQLFALSLPYPLLDAPQARKVLEVVEAMLYTPRGLRTLAPSDPAYCPHYGGDQRARDGAYHQGTVWSWLLGPFVSALVAVRPKRGPEQARALLQAMVAHLHEAGIGSVSEIFDAEPPHAPRGCIAQAWSVAEILRAHVETAQG